MTSRHAPHRLLFVIAVLALPALPAPGADENAAPPSNERPVILHLISGTEVSGVILDGGFDEATGVRLRRDDNGGLLELRWDQILPDDVDAIKRAYGFIGDEPPPIQVRALRLNVRNGSSVTGIDGGRQGGVHVIYRRGVATQVPVETIESRETVVVDALEVENPAEAFERVRREQPPESSVEWYNLGLAAEGLTLFEQAAACFEAALALDEDFAKKSLIEKRIKLLDSKAKEVEAATMLRNIKALRLQKQFAGALKLVTEFQQKWPASTLLSDVLKEQKVLAIAQREDLLNQIRTDFFPIARALCMTKALDSELELGPAMTWAEELCFTETIQKLAKQKKIEESEMQKLWDARGKYGSATAVSFGGGTFILGTEARDGLVKKDGEEQATPGDEDSEANAKPLTLQEKIQQKLKDRQAAAAAANKKQKTQDGGELADVPPSPEEWWKGASTTERNNFLFAFFAQHARNADGKKGMILIERVTARDCSTCAGQGILETYQTGANSAEGMGLLKIPCPRCKKLTFDRIIHCK
jgi:tetratricopeptide (TPR) repeat protein